MIRIGITGGSGSGKTQFCEGLCNAIGVHKVLIISGDNFYKDLSHMSEEEQRKVDFDSPASYDFEELAATIELFKHNAHSIVVPKYDFITHTRSGYTEHKLDGIEVVIFEGIFMFYNKNIRGLFDYKFFIDAPADERLVRRTVTCSQRGWNMTDFMSKWGDQIQPGYKKYISPTREYADLIIPSNTRGPNKMFTKTMGFIKMLLEGK